MQLLLNFVCKFGSSHGCYFFPPGISICRPAPRHVELADSAHNGQHLAVRRIRFQASVYFFARIGSQADDFHFFLPKFATMDFKSLKIKIQ